VSSDTPTPSPRETWIHVRPFIVGTASEWGMAHESDLVQSKTRKAAWTRGCRIFGHDDFWVATFDGKRITGLYSGPEGPKRRGTKELREANEEFGFSPEVSR
jgi:hypothetical protein